ncbi:hypothetical protein BEWA_028620 [Theileria equi strain WA]|uniref:Uncharacterized protein n=1 Tax=Theileria equi strain WA TaxID=1537102 RepID=L0AWP4_THEEQ|nr:hypothetical protein BEWA_028620 [Theileria equi strain WA]AFZ80012.1 hypothetical protein BEWA_028620 [Theileria equi strain WA]|eukprot:XP_004829678.1 hypothetical protein BEWA_028620 [Theileria equi strain WA]
MARMRVITPRGSEFIWFENYRGVWIQLTEKTFVESWERLKRVRKFEFDKPFNKLVFTKQPYCSITGIGTIIFIDRGYKVMAVVDGEQELWSSEEQTCNYILIHGEVGGAESATDGQGEFSGARLVNISVRFKDKYEDLYFAKMGKYWIECQYSQFRKMLIEERDRLCMNITETRKENTDGREDGPSTSGNS